MPLVFQPTPEIKLKATVLLSINQSIPNCTMVKNGSGEKHQIECLQIVGAGQSRH